MAVEVRDTGPGIPPADRERLQQPYQQGREGGGLGLGLAISRKLIEMHGSRLELVGGHKAGACIRFVLPQADGPETSSSPPLADSAPGTPRAPRGAGVEGPAAADGARIPVVDDNDDAAAVLQQQLVLAGYRVERAARGEEALRGVAEAPPALVMLDVMMPDMSGLEVCRRLREEYDDNTLPIILVTARSRESDVVEGLNAGADDYLAKPFCRVEMLARVKAQLRVQTNEQMRWALHEQSAQTPADPRRLLVRLLQKSLRYWELETGKNKADLAEQSGLWTVPLDGSTRKTRTLDRDLKEETLP